MKKITLNSCFEAKRTFYVCVWSYGFDDIIIEHTNDIVQVDLMEEGDIKSKIEKQYHEMFPYEYVDVFPLTWAADGIEFKDRPIK